jgi:hypothetical protein
MLAILMMFYRRLRNIWIYLKHQSKLILLDLTKIISKFITKKRFINVGPRLSSLLICMEDKNPFSLDSNQYIMLSSYLYHNNDKEINDEIEKFDKLIFMEYGLKVGHDFESKCENLNNSGLVSYSFFLFVIKIIFFFL